MPKRSRAEGRNTHNICKKKKKHFNELDNHHGVVSYPELAILEFEVKWALGSTAVNKARGWDGEGGGRGVQDGGYMYTHG